MKTNQNLNFNSSRNYSQLETQKNDRKQPKKPPLFLLPRAGELEENHLIRQHLAFWITPRKEM